MSDKIYALKTLVMENYKGSASNVTIKFNDNITYLVGVNGTGKSMIASAIQYLFQGKTFFNNKYRRRMISDGANKLKLKAVFLNSATEKEIIVTHSLTEKDNTTITIKTNTGEKLSLTELKELINPLFLRPFDIIKKTPQQQAEMVGVNTKKYDDKIGDYKKQLTPYRVNLTRLKGVIKDYGEMEEITPVSIVELADELRIAQSHNQKIANAKDEYSKINQNIEDIQTEIELLLEKIKGLKQKKENLLIEKQIKKDLAKEPLIDESEIEMRIQSIEDHNKKANDYSNYLEKKNELINAQKEFDIHEKAVINAIKEKMEYIKAQELPKGLNIDDDGGLTISAFGQKNAYLCEEFFSRGEITKLAIMLCLVKIRKAKKMNKEVIPLIVIDNAESLDIENQKYICDMADKYKIQFALMLVDRGGENPDNAIYLKEEKLLKKNEGI